VNAVSGIAGPVSPGEIISIRGYNAGASQVSGLRLDASGTVGSSLNSSEVTFDLIVPYGVAGKASTVMQVVL
jgi:uncharacterized protein (TIGR03437 family)